MGNFEAMTAIDPKVYLRAAELVDQCESAGCCTAIFAINKHPVAREFFESIFRNDGIKETGKITFWMSSPELSTEQCNSHRVYALLLAHEIAKDEAGSLTETKEGA